MAIRHRLYLESSFWDRLADATSPDRRRATYRFLSKVQHRHDLFISELVEQEIAETPDPEERRTINRLLARARAHRLHENRGAERVATELLRLGGRNKKVFADFTHLGYTIVAGIDVLVTWDMDDLACHRTRLLAQYYGRLHRVSVPYIGTPEEVGPWLGLRTPGSPR